MPMTINLGGVGGALSVTRYQAPVLDLANTQITIDGDSLTDLSYNEMEYGVDAWPMRLGDVLLPTTAVQVLAVAGSTLAFFEESPHMNSTARRNAFDAAMHATKFNIAVAWCGTNDIAQGGTGAATLSQLTSWVSGRRTAGADYVAVLNCAWRSEIASDPDRTTFNSGLSGVGADLVIDVATALGNATSNPAHFQADLIHLTQTAMTVVANTVHAALSAALG